MDSVDLVQLSQIVTRLKSRSGQWARLRGEKCLRDTPTMARIEADLQRSIDEVTSLVDARLADLRARMRAECARCGGTSVVWDAGDREAGIQPGEVMCPDCEDVP